MSQLGWILNSSETFLPPAIMYKFQKNDIKQKPMGTLFTFVMYVSFHQYPNTFATSPLERHSENVTFSLMPILNIDVTKTRTHDTTWCWHLAKLAVSRDHAGNHSWSEQQLKLNSAKIIKMLQQMWYFFLQLRLLEASELFLCGMVGGWQKSAYTISSPYQATSLESRLWLDFLHVLLPLFASMYLLPSLYIFLVDSSNLMGKKCYGETDMVGISSP